MSAQRKLMKFGARPPFLMTHYRRLVLVSIARHLDGLDAADTESLIVTHSWLMWQKLVSQGRHCVHYECYAPTRVMPADDDTFIRINDWLFDGSNDPSMFRGISLARMFAKEMQVLILESKRLNTALEELLAGFAPSEIVFHDFRGDHSVLDIGGRHDLVVKAARARGVSVIDRRDAPKGDDPELPFSEWFGRHERPDTDQPSLFRRLAVQAFSIGFGRLGRGLRGLFKSRPAVLLATTHLVALPLLNAFKGEGKIALILSDWYPRKRSLSFLLENLLKGILPVTLGRASLDSQDTATLNNLVASLNAHWRSHDDSVVALCREYFLKYIVETGRIRAIAVEIKTIENMLRRIKPDVVLTDGVDYYLCVMMLSVAKRLGIATVATWHAPFVQDIKLALLGCDPRLPSAAQNFFSWSDVNDRWLQNIGADVNVIRTGNPVSRRSTIRAISDKGDRKLRILLLQYAGTGEDYLFPQALQYEFFVEAVRVLDREFDAEIRLKIHPGPYSGAYYQAVVDWFGLEAAVYKNEPFSDLLGWADVVIGPAASGAMMEVAGTGKPYLPILLQPSLVNRDYFDNVKVFDDASELVEAISSGTYTSAGAIEAEFSGNACARNSPASAMWDALDRLCLNHKMEANRE